MMRKVLVLLPIVISLCVFIVPSPVHAANITELVWNESSGNVTSTDGTDPDIDKDSTLVSFKVGTDEFSSFVLSNTNSFSLPNGDISPFWGQNAAVPLTINDDILSVTDNRLDTGLVNMSDNGEFFFPSSPTSLDQMLFIFEVGSDDGDRRVELIDGPGGNVVGSFVTVNFSGSEVANIDFTRANGAGTYNTSNTGFKGRAVSFGVGGFDLTSGQLSSVAGVRIDGGNVLDPSLIGFTVPEPSTLVLTVVGLSGLLGFGRRPKR